MHNNPSHVESLSFPEKMGKFQYTFSYDTIKENYWKYIDDDDVYNFEHELKEYYYKCDEYRVHYDDIRIIYGIDFLRPKTLEPYLYTVLGRWHQIIYDIWINLNWTFGL